MKSRSTVVKILWIVFVENRVCRNPCVFDMGLGLVQSTEEENKEDVSPMVSSRYDEGQFRTSGHHVEGNEQSMEGMSIGGARNEYNSKECMEAIGMDLEGGGKEPTSC